MPLMKVLSILRSEYNTDNFKDEFGFDTNASLWINLYPGTTTLSKLSFPKLSHVRHLVVPYITVCKLLTALPLSQK